MKRLLFLLMLVATSASARQLTLAWDSSVGATGYKVYWGTSSRVYPNVLDVGPATQATITHLTETITYFFAVTAYNEAGESDYSDEISETIPFPPPEFLAMYPGIFTWSYPSFSDTMTGFVLHRKEVGIRGVRQWRILDPSARSIAMTDLRPGSTYDLWVQAFTEYQGDPIYSAASETLNYLEPLTPYFGEPQLLPPDITDDGRARITYYDFEEPHLLASPDLFNWEDLGQMAPYAVGRYQFIDPQAVLFTQRFYRVRGEAE